MLKLFRLKRASEAHGVFVCADGVARAFELGVGLGCKFLCIDARRRAQYTAVDFDFLGRNHHPDEAAQDTSAVGRDGEPGIAGVVFGGLVAHSVQQPLNILFIEEVAGATRYIHLKMCLLPGASHIGDRGEHSLVESHVLRAVVAAQVVECDTQLQPAGLAVGYIGDDAGEVLAQYGVCIGVYLLVDGAAHLHTHFLGPGQHPYGALAGKGVVAGYDKLDVAVVVDF